METSLLFIKPTALKRGVFGNKVKIVVKSAISLSEMLDFAQTAFSIFYMVIFAVVKFISYDKIFNPVVKSIFVKMMNYFISAKVSAYTFFHYHSVLSNIPSSVSKWMSWVADHFISRITNNPHFSIFSSRNIFNIAVSTTAIYVSSFLVSITGIFDKFVTIHTIRSYHGPMVQRG